MSVGDKTSYSNTEVIAFRTRAVSNVDDSDIGKCFAADLIASSGVRYKVQKLTKQV